MFSSLWKEKKEESSRTMEMLLTLVLFCILLQPARVSSTSQGIDQGYIDSNAGRTLQQEQDGNHQIHCSRERSRAAQKIIQEYLMPFVEKEKYHISRSCKFHPDNDLYRDQEQHKSHININEWQCGYCKKIFYEEKYLDQHFDNRHSNLLNLNQSQCLADLCGALHCDIEINSGLKKSKCNPAAAARNKHLCESLADSCFPVNDGPAASRLHEFFLHQFCDAHSCTGSRKPFSRGRRRDEKGNSTVEAHHSNWQKEKTILMDRSVTFGSSRFSNTFRMHSKFTNL
ncbi:uncharacterized protein LOC107482087 isoform X3 [Arachis duranensis]|uniref:Uncharacterized protein LOC107482087 isoform X3 n=1 Tax=Arachis duranensis TaxID=130453 RepID=A0A6P4CXD1_ARADU|nr:uncharacterized protein LOC107482087 isoform X3 [Arachis duranensis]